MSHLFRYYVFLRQVLEGVGVVFSTTNMEHNWKQWNKIYHEGIKERDQDIVGFINSYNLEIEQLGKLSITLDNPSVSVWEPLEGEVANVLAHGMAMEGKRNDYPMYWLEEVLREVEKLVDRDRRGFVESE
ncbi:hypothetical protein Goklo_006199 [Gossypium klotzschianum]|uniref:Uncharacterized protein n=1 Tax=Gossypium klotzschianum TaxID=34286 RepID=A0A7J8VGS1_9ROSI|nr:hypothetical protein [Gossypium klotzschianum]